MRSRRAGGDALARQWMGLDVPTVDELRQDMQGDPGAGWRVITESLDFVHFMKTAASRKENENFDQTHIG